LRNPLLWKIFYLQEPQDPMSNPTLKKIAEILGVSVSTVSRGLQQHPDISKATRQKIIDLAASLDYEPNASAVQLRTRNSKLLGILVPTISNFFYDSFISAIEEAGRKNGYSIMILQSGNDPAIEADNLKLLRQNRISGLFACISPQTGDLSQYAKFREQETPVVFFDVVPESETIYKVCMADGAAGQLAAEALIGKKKKRIHAIFGNNQMSITQKRKTAFTETLLRLDPAVSVTPVYATSSSEAKSITASALQQKQQPDAIFCMSDEILIGTMKALQESRIRIPEEIGVISISNGFIPKLFYPEITYVETNGHMLGELAFNQMMLYLKQAIPFEEKILDVQLVRGGSL
jgi:LacI family transcriptional regulator